VNSQEWAVYNLINSYRNSSSQCFSVTGGGWRAWNSSDRRTLALSPTLQSAAHNYAAWLAANWAGQDVHTADGRSIYQRIYDAGYRNFTLWGEIAAINHTSAQAAVNGWKESPGHNLQMLFCQAEAVGVGYASGVRRFWIANFGDYADGNLAD
jgi:uncharacterized protein YkwD